MAIRYQIGDIFTCPAQGDKILIHVCNDVGAWGAGFVLALSKAFPQAESEYRSMAFMPDGSMLGKVQFVHVRNSPGEHLYIANMIAQRSTRFIKDGSKTGCPPVRYPALMTCLEAVAKFASDNKLSVISPKFGAGLAGGDWKLIEMMMGVAFKDLDVTVYELAPASAQVAQPALAEEIL